jgi:hypothetical protein
MVHGGHKATHAAHHHVVSMVDENVVPQPSLRDPNLSGSTRSRSSPQRGRSSPSLFDLGLSGPEGDAAAARAFAESLLICVAPGQDRRDARLLLTAVCLHLQSRNGPDPTLVDLVDWLSAAGGGGGDILAKLRGEPLSLSEYAVSELGSLAASQQSLALEMALSAAKFAQALP